MEQSVFQRAWVAPPFQLCLLPHREPLCRSRLHPVPAACLYRPVTEAENIYMRYRSMMLSTAEGILFRDKICFGSRMYCLIKQVPLGAPQVNLLQSSLKLISWRQKGILEYWWKIAYNDALQDSLFTVSFASGVRYG